MSMCRCSGYRLSIRQGLDPAKQVEQATVRLRFASRIVKLAQKYSLRLFQEID